MASISKKIGSITARTTTGSQATTGLGFAPKLLILWTNSMTGDGTAADACLMAQGMSDGATSAWAAYFSKDNQSTSVARSSHSTAAGKIIGFANADGTLIFEAGLTSLDSDGFTLDYTTVDGVARIIQYLAIGGNGQFKVGTNTSPTSTGLQTISGVGFAPTGCIFLCPRVPSGTQTQTTANFSYGFSDSGGQQMGQVVYSTDGFGAGLIDCGRRTYTDLCMQAMNNTPSGVLIARHSSYNGDGLVLNWTNVEGTAWRYIYCCIGKLKCRVQEDSMRTTTGNQAYTGTGFTPSILLQASNTINGWYSENLVSNGAAVSTSQRFAMSSADQYHGNPTNGHYGQDSTKVMQTRYADTFNVIQAADLVSFDSDGYTLNFTSVNGNADKIESMAIGETTEETKVVAGGESLNEQSTTSSSDQDALSVTLDAEASATYLIIATWQSNESTVAIDNRAKLVNTTDAVTYQSMNWAPSDATDYPTFMALGIFTNGGSPATKTFKLQYSTEVATATTAKIKNARIIIIKKGAEDQTVEDTGRITTTASGDTDATTLTFTPASAGWYLFLAGADVDNSSTTPRTRAILELDGTNKVTSEIHVSDTSTVWSWGAMFIAAISKASHSIKIQYSTSTATTTTAGIQRRRIFALRLDKFLNAYFNNSTAISRTTSTSTTYADKATVTQTPVEGKHLIIGGQTVDENSTTISVFSKLLEDSSDINEALKEPSNASDRWDFMVAYQKSLPASSKTWKLQYKTETNGTAAGAAESALIVLQLNTTYSLAHTTDAALKGTSTKTHTTDADLKGAQTKTHTTDALKKATFTKTHSTDALLKKAQTVSHTTDADLKGARTKTHTTDADLKGARTLVHSSDAALKGERTVSHNTDADLKGALLQTHSTDATLKGAQTIAHSTDADLKGTGTLSHSSDADLKGSRTIDHSTDADLKGAVIKTHATDAVLRASQIKTHSSDALLRAVNAIAHQTDACLRFIFTVGHSTDALLKAIQSVQHSTDASLRATFIKAHTTDAHLQAIQVVQHTTDASLRATFAASHTTDALLLAVQTVQQLTDALLRAAFIKTHATDALLRAVQNIQHSTDASLILVLTRAHSTDALLRATVQKMHFTDAFLRATQMVTHATDSLLRAALSVGHHTNALLRAAFTRSHNTDALLQAIRTKEHSTDALLRATQIAQHSVDSLLKATLGVHHETDSLLLKAQQIAHQTDALLLLQSVVYFYTDALLKGTFGISHGTDTLLRGTLTLAHGTDALLRKESTLSHGTDSLLSDADSAGKYLGAFFLGVNDIFAMKEPQLNDVIGTRVVALNDAEDQESGL